MSPGIYGERSSPFEELLEDVSSEELVPEEEASLLVTAFPEEGSELGGLEVGRDEEERLGEELSLRNSVPTFPSAPKILAPQRG